MQNQIPQQSQRKQVRVAFSGSGFLAGIHAGAVSALMDAGYEIIEVAGTSGGSIVAAATACGLNQKQLHDLAVNTDMSNLLEFDLDSIIHAEYCDGNNLYDWLNVQFNNKTINQTTIPCKIVATNVEIGKPFIFSAEDTPNVPLALACRASSAVPYIYEEVVYNNKKLIDGGVCDNIPVDKLVQDDILRVGIDVGSSEVYDVSNKIAYAGSIISMLLANGEDNLINLEKTNGAKIIIVPPGNAFFLNTNLSVEEKQKLFDAGYAATKEKLNL